MTVAAATRSEADPNVSMIGYTKLMVARMVLYKFSGLTTSYTVAASVKQKLREVSRA